MKLNRRDFLKTTAVVSIPLFVGGMHSAAMATPRSSSQVNDRILVLIQLQGGNDGLATVLDINQYDNLQHVRGNILVPETNLIQMSGDTYLHPSAAGLRDLWNSQQLGIIESVGYPNQNRSHFRSTDIWNTASSAEYVERTGWIGRYFDNVVEGYPQGFPNSEHPHPFALTLGETVSETCEGASANYSLSLLDPLAPGSIDPGTMGEYGNSCYADAIGFVNTVVEQTNVYSATITEAYAKGANLSTKWNSLATEIGQNLKDVARLIAGGLMTQVYVVQLGGFDTHDNQVVGSDTSTGIHSTLLQELSEAVCAFQDDLALLNIDKRVVGVTYSEFGRRIRSNSALGTDHGTAAPMFVFGTCVNNMIHGEHPAIDVEAGIDEGVPMQFDFRNAYGSLLEHWLEVEEEDIRSLLYSDYQGMPLFEADCLRTNSYADTGTRGLHVHVYPNPAKEFLYVHIQDNSSSAAQLRVFDTIGSLVYEQQVSGAPKVYIPVKSLPPGRYFVHVQSTMGIKVVPFVRE